MSGSVTARGYSLFHASMGDEIARIGGTVDGESVHAFAFWHSERLLWSVALQDESSHFVGERREVSTLVDACHAVRDMARAARMTKV